MYFIIIIIIMKCNLCNKDIKKFNLELNQFEVDHDKVINVCQDCVDKFLKWQQKVFAKLFPTALMKKRFNK